MAEVHIPAMLRGLTGGRSTVEARGATVGEMVDDLEARWPGLRARLMDGDRLLPNLSVAVDGEISPLGAREAVGPSSEVHFVTAIRGGRAGAKSHADLG
jgi:molybdopterin converting factor small subunit